MRSYTAGQDGDSRASVRTLDALSGRHRVVQPLLCFANLNKDGAVDTAIPWRRCVAATSQSVWTLVGKVVTLAGSGTGGYKDGAAATAQFSDPSGVAVDSKGNVYVADQNNDRVRRIAGGKVTTIAGSGTIGMKDGPALSAQFDTPIDVEVDATGRVFVADQNNHAIRVIKGGKVSTLAGDGYTGYKDGPALKAQFNFPTGLAMGPKGKLYVADQINARIRVISW